MSLDVLSALKGARELLADPDNWTQGASARDENGRELADRLLDEGVCSGFNTAEYAAVVHPQACCWCLGGAIDRAAGEGIRFDDKRMAVLWELVDWRVGPWNDTHTYEDVLAVLDEAIAAASPRDRSAEGDRMSDIEHTHEGKDARWWAEIAEYWKAQADSKHAAIGALEKDVDDVRQQLQGAVEGERGWLERLYPYIADIEGAPALKAEIRTRLRELGGSPLLPRDSQETNRG